MTAIQLKPLKLFNVTIPSTFIALGLRIRTQYVALGLATVLGAVWFVAVLTRRREARPSLDMRVVQSASWFVGELSCKPYRYLRGNFKSSFSEKKREPSFYVKL